MGDLLQTLRNLGPSRLAAIGGAAVVVIGLLIFFATKLSTPTMGLLYADLSTKDSGAVAQKLDAMGVSYTVRGDGSIMAPADQVPRLRGGFRFCQGNWPCQVLAIALSPGAGSSSPQV